MPDAPARDDCFDEIDRAIVRATQAGLPLVPRPYHAVAEQVGVTPGELMTRLSRMQMNGIIRRIGAVPNHYRLGYCANGMSVWDVPDHRIAAVGPRVGALPFVTHCYHRPRCLPEWRFNLFAMVHGHNRDEVEQQVNAIAELLGNDVRAHTVLYSTRILKKTGMRF
jgi:DNA-binding Lrp family transcriptional regulator